MTTLTDEQIIERCKAAGIKWIPPELPDDCDYEMGFPGSFDMVSMGEMRALLSASMHVVMNEARWAALEDAALAVEKHDTKGREWIPGSLWGQLTRESAERIRGLAECPAAPNHIGDADEKLGAADEHSQCCDTPEFCSSVRRCTAKDGAAPAQWGEPVALRHVAVAEDGGQLRWMPGIRPHDCELYSMPDGGQAPTLYAVPQSAPPAREACQIDNFSGRVCQHGTQSCVAEHGGAQPASGGES